MKKKLLILLLSISCGLWPVSEDSLMEDINKGNTGNIIASLTTPFNINFILQSNTVTKVNQSYQGETPLTFATQKGNKDIINILLLHGANANFKNKKGELPLTEATIQGNLDLIELFIARGADINAQNKSGSTALLIASAKARTTTSDYYKIATYLIGKGARKDIKDNLGNDFAYYLKKSKLPVPGEMPVPAPVLTPVPSAPPAPVVTPAQTPAPAPTPIQK